MVMNLIGKNRLYATIKTFFYVGIGMKDWNEKANRLTLSQLGVKSLQKDSKKI